MFNRTDKKLKNQALDIAQRVFTPEGLDTYEINFIIEDSPLGIQGEVPQVTKASKNTFFVSFIPTLFDDEPVIYVKAAKFDSDGDLVRIGHYQRSGEDMNRHGVAVVYDRQRRINSTCIIGESCKFGLLGILAVILYEDKDARTLNAGLLEDIDKVTAYSLDYSKQAIKDAYDDLMKRAYDVIKSYAGFYESKFTVEPNPIIGEGTLGNYYRNKEN